jgi:hypothetical protein
MRVRHIGTGSVHLEGFGDVASGDTIGVSDEYGARLVAEMPTEFEQVTEDEPASPAPRPRQGRTATTTPKGGGD